MPRIGCGLEDIRHAATKSACCNHNQDIKEVRIQLLFLAEFKCGNRTDCPSCDLVNWPIHLTRIAQPDTLRVKDEGASRKVPFRSGGIGAIGWSSLGAVLPEVFDKFSDVDAGCPADGSDNIFGGLVIDFLIPFREV